MAKGSWYWASSYIVLNNGRKIYLETHISELEEKINSKATIIELKTSGLYGKTIKVIRKSIQCYGKK